MSVGSAARLLQVKAGGDFNQQNINIVDDRSK
jgi:hypothetical protein